jgi:hypothetical protein
MGNHLPTRWVFMGTHSPTQFFRGKAYAPEPHATLYRTLLFLGNHFEPPSLSFLYTQRPVFLWKVIKPPQDCFPIFFGKDLDRLARTNPN